jgi:hypothetical protein
MIFIDNKYTHWYYQITNAAQARLKPNGYTERHHIIPESFSGPNTPENLVYLTAREHFLCHWLLTKMVTGTNKAKMVNAFWAMCTLRNEHQGARHVIPGRIYEKVRNKISVSRSEAWAGKNNPNWGGFSDQHRENLSKAKRGKKPSNFDKWVRASKGKSYYHNLALNQEKRFLPNEVPRGWIKGRLKVQCSCGKAVDISNFKKYHSSCGG